VNGLRVKETSDAVSVRPARSRFVVAVVCILWNVGFAPFFFAHHQPDWLEEIYVGGAWLFLALVALREAFLVTRFTFADRTFTVRPSPPAPWSRGLSLPLGDVDRVDVRPEKDGSFRLYVIVRGGESRRVPLSLDGPPLSVNWSTKVMFAAPVERWEWLATRLNERLDEARHETGPTYR
jgi:hypothetical protein